METLTQEALLQELAAERRARQAAEKLAEARGKELERLQTVASHPYNQLPERKRMLLHLKAPALLTDSDDRIVLLNEALCTLLKLPQQPRCYAGVSLEAFEQDTLTQTHHIASEPTRFSFIYNGEPNQKRKVLERERVPLTEDAEGRGAAIWLYRDVTLRHRKQRELELQSELQEEYPNPILRLSFAGEILFVNVAGTKLLDSLTEKRMAGFKRLLLVHIKKLSLHTTSQPASFESHIGKRYYATLITPRPDKGYFNIYMSDITKRKNAEQALKESQNIAQTIAHTIPNLVYLYDLEDGAHVYANEQVNHVLGYTHEDIAKLGDDVLATLVIPGDLEKVYAHVCSIMLAKDGDILELEYRARCKNGDIKILHCRESVFKRRDNGQVKQVIGSAEDVTNARQQSLELRRQKAFYEAILNNIPSDVAVYNHQMQHIFLNPAAVGDAALRQWLIGKTNEEYRQRRGYPEERFQMRNKALEQVQQTKKLVEFEEQLQDKNGNITSHLRRLNPVHNEAGELQYVIGHGLNITELKRAQAVILASEAKNRAILAAIPDLLFIIDGDGNFVDMNEVDQKHLPVPKGEVIGNNIKNLPPRELGSEMLALVQNVIRTGQPEKKEYDLPLPEGTRYYEGRFFKYTDNQVFAIVRDTTEERHAALEAKAKNEFIQLVLDSSPSLIYVKDGEGNFVLVNDEFAALFGRTVGEVEGRNAADFFPNKKEMRFYLDTDRQVIQENREIKLQERFTSSNGDVIWFSTTKKPLVTADGQVHVLGISTNMTEQRIANKRLQHSEELHRLLSENSRDLISLHNPDGSYVYASKAVEEMLGYSQIELLLLEAYIVIHPDDRELVRAQGFKEALQQKASTTRQYRVVHKKGGVFWVETNLKPILDAAGNVTKIQSATRDITSRKKAEEALQLSEKKYRDLINYSQAFICTHDLDGIIQAVNPYLMNMLGYTSCEMVGKSLSAFFPAANKPLLDSYLRQFDGSNVVDGVLTILNKENEERNLFYQNYKVEEPDTAPYIIGIAQDITDRLRTEQHLKKAKEAAEESARVKENFMANMSHEIRTPMNGILGMAGLMHKTQLNDVQQNYLNIIHQSADNLLVVINDILDIAKIEAGKMELEVIPFELAEAVKSAYQSFIYKAEEKEIAFVLKPLQLPHTMLLGDPYRLHQVLLNLLNNAIKFTEEGCVSLTCQVLQQTDEDLTVEIAVSDTGIGIPASKLNMIFDGFTQAYSSTTRKYGGTGLGLSICKTLVEMQRGHIIVESEEGKGSTFKVRITYSKTNEALPVQKEEAIDYNSLNHLHILLAEDNEVNVFLAQSIIEGWGAKVDVAYNGREAVDMADLKLYDVILMDIQMPDLSGIDATHKIRQHADKTKAHVPIIAMTANALKGDAEKYMSAGMNDYISKPFEEEKLFLKIASVLPQPVVEICDAAVVTAVAEPQGPEEPLFDLAVLYKLSRGNEAFMQRAQQLFIDTVPVTVADMQQKLHNGNWEGVSAAAHKLKSSVDTMRIESLKDVVRRIECNGKLGAEFQTIGSDVVYVQEMVERVIQQMKAGLTS